MFQCMSINKKHFVKKEENDVVKKNWDRIPRNKTQDGTKGREKKAENLVQEKGHEMSKVDIYLTIWK